MPPPKTVLRVVGVVQRTINAGICALKGHVALDATGADAAIARCDGAHEPSVLGPIGGSDVDVVAMAYRPDRDESAKAAVGSPRRDLQLVRGADAAELVIGPGRHHSAFTSSA